MIYASLMVYVDEGAETEARVALACDLAVRFDARLIGISASLPDAPQVDPYAGGAMLGEMLGLFRDMAEANARTADVAVFLGRHDIVASAQVLQRDDGARSGQILKFADDHQAGLIVAGGYGHARMREWVLGGVTHGLLGASPVCLMLSH